MIGEKEAMAAYRLTAQETAKPFQGIGFHMSGHTFDRKHACADAWDTVFAKRLAELRPTYMRLWHHWDWTREDLDHVARHVQALKAIGAEVYLTTQTAKAAETGEALAAYADLIADHLAYLILEKGCDNIRHYCMSNELRMYYHGDMFFDMAVFERTHRALHAAFRARGLSVGLLATDVSGEERWLTNLRWTAAHMDDITAGYVAHAYLPFWPRLNHPSMPDYPFDNPYRVWLQNGVSPDVPFAALLKSAVGLAEEKGKRFVLGEFGVRGPKGNTWLDKGIVHDECADYEGENAAYVPVQLAQIAVLAIRAGVYSACYWALEDYPDAYHPKRTNHWGVYRWDGGFAPRACYFGLGLVTRFMRGPSVPLTVEGDPAGFAPQGVYVAGLVHADNGSTSVLVVNRNQIPRMPLSLSAATFPEGAKVYKYQYVADCPPDHPFADLAGPVQTLEAGAAGIRDLLPPWSITVYTNDVEEQLLPAVEDVQWEATDKGVQVRWKPVDGAIYYRVYRGADAADAGRQAISTVSTQWTDGQADGEPHYSVVAVDRSLRAGRQE